MLCQSGAAQGMAPGGGSRRVSVFKPLMAVSILALSCAAAVGPAQATGFFDGRNRADFLDSGVYNWSGIYVGGHVGGAWGNADWSVLETPFNNAVVGGTEDPAFTAFPEGGRVSQDVDGWLAGGHLGFNQQFGRWVGGVEVSLGGGDVNGSSKDEVSFDSLGFRRDHAVGLRTEIDSLFLATVRLGYAWDRFLTYFKGGYASADVDIRGSEEFFSTQLTTAGATPIRDREGAFSSSERHHGFTIGGGFEYALTNNVIFGLEYNYVDLGSVTHIGRAKIIDINGTDEVARHDRFTVKVDPDELHTAMARLSFKFGGDEPTQVAALPSPPLK